MPLSSLAVVLAAYLIGSVPFALILARHWGAADLRRIGSGNIGAANVVRASGMTAGVLVALLDLAKGATSVLLAQRLSPDAAAPEVAGLAAIVGHIYPVWFGFRGGKGVATACGVFSMLAPLAAGPAVAIFIVTVWATKYVSLGSVLASGALPPIAYVTGSQAPVVMAAFAAAGIIIFRHRSNLMRLRAGTERRLGVRDAPAPCVVQQGHHGPSLPSLDPGQDRSQIATGPVGMGPREPRKS
jgi:glycerol-3-phosphate acyltransferase PlsY